MNDFKSRNTASNIYAKYKEFGMKKFVLASLIFAACTVAGVGHVTANTDLFSIESIIENTYLGKVNLCDGNGIVCYVGEAFKSSNGRIYVSLDNATYWAQTSNDSRWAYMIRYNNNWCYFNL